MNYKNIFTLLWLSFIGCFSANTWGISQDGPVSVTEPKIIQPFTATVESIKGYKTPEWFRNAKFGIWNVWGPYSVAENGEWYPRTLYINEHEMDWQVGGPQHIKNWGHQSKFGYKDFIPLWKAENFDPDALLEKYKKAGAKYYTSIATFHDNFDLFDSKHTRWDSVEQGPKKDIVKLFQEATHKVGLRYGTTTHLERSLRWWQVNKGTKDEPYDGVDPDYVDLYHPAYNPDDPKDNHIAQEWAEMWNKRLIDLIDNYELDLFYFDGHIPYGEKGYDVVSHFYNNNMQRHNGADNGVMFIKHWPKDENGNIVPNVATLDFENRKSDRILPQPWQTDDHIGSWGYQKDVSYKETNYVVDKLIDIVSKNGNLLLCIPLKADGTHDAETEKFLEEMGEWMAVNSEAIYDTRPWKTFGEGPARRDADTHYNIANEEGFNHENIRFMQKDDSLFAFQMGCPIEPVLTIKALGKSTEFNKKAIKSVTMVGTNTTLNFTQTSNALKVQLPNNRQCQHAYAVAVKFED